MECPPRDESFRDPCHDILRRPVAMSCSGEVPTDTADGDGEDNFVDDERNGNNVEVGVGGADEALSSEACPNSKVHVHVHVANEKKYSSPPDLSLAAVVPIRPRADPVQRGGQLLRSPPVLLANILPRRPVRLELRRGFGPHLRLPAGVRDIGPGLRPDRHDRRRVQGLVRTRAVPRRRRPVPRPLPPLPAICRCVAGGCGAAPGPRFAAVVRCHFAIPPGILVARYALGPDLLAWTQIWFSVAYIALLPIVVLPLALLGFALESHLERVETIIGAADDPRALVKLAKRAWAAPKC